MLEGSYATHNEVMYVLYVGVIDLGRRSSGRESSSMLAYSPSIN